MILMVSGARYGVAGVDVESFLSDYKATLYTIYQDDIQYIITDGVDEQADLWAKNAGVDRITMPANWKKYGKEAGRKRNRAMLYMGRVLAEEFVTQLHLIAFPGPKSVGTWDMVNACKAKGVSMQVVVPHES